MNSLPSAEHSIDRKFASCWSARWAPRPRFVAFLDSQTAARLIFASRGFAFYEKRSGEPRKLVAISRDTELHTRATHKVALPKVLF